MKIVALLTTLCFLSFSFATLLVVRNASSPTGLPAEIIPPQPEIDPLSDGESALNQEDLEALRAELKSLEAAPTKPFMTIEVGQTLTGILQGKGVSNLEIHVLSQALREYVNPKDIKELDLIHFDLEGTSDKKIKTFELIKRNPFRVPITYSMKRIEKGDDFSFSMQKTESPVTKKARVINLEVKGTLFATFMTLPFGDELMNALMTVLAWKMRMPEEVMSGDRIQILVMEKYVGDEMVGYGNIDSVRYLQASRQFFATYFKSDDGKIRGYFDEHGVSLEREFLISPLEETTATSNLRWRMHPVRKIRIPHNGIDFRGVIGTPFFAIANGHVIEKRFDTNVGYMIRLQHKYGITSEYFHADSLREDLVLGSKVKRGETIGALGDSGYLCTGPHLHLGLFRTVKNKKQFLTVTQLRKQLAKAEDLPKTYLAEFRKSVDSKLANMGEKGLKLLANN